MFFHMKPLSTDIQEIVWSWCPQHFSVPSEPKTLLNINITNSSSLWHFYARLLFVMIANCFLLSVLSGSYSSTGSSPEFTSLHFHQHFSLTHLLFFRLIFLIYYCLNLHNNTKHFRIYLFLQLSKTFFNN